ncbi:MAG: hypothetical protein RR528_05410, partial [Angelakisella sp.]
RAQNSSINGWLLVGNNGNVFRVFESEGDNRGFYIDITQCDPRSNTVLATATPPQEFDLPLAAGFVTSDVISTYSKDQFGFVHVSFKVVKSTGIAAGATTIATLPVGFSAKPGHVTHNICTSALFDGKFYVFFVDELGKITVVVGNDMAAGSHCGFAGSISFLT